MKLQPLIGLSNIVLISRTNKVRWASMDFSLSTVKFSSSFNIKFTVRGTQVLLFADEREISKFIASKDEVSAPLRGYVKLMRTLPSQRFVLTFEELASEVGSRVPKFSQFRTEYQIVESIMRSSTMIEQDASHTFDYMMKGHDGSASAIIRKSFFDTETHGFSEHRVFIALAWLGFRSRMRLCSSIEGFKQMKPGPEIFFYDSVEGFTIDSEPSRDEYWAFLDQENTISLSVATLSGKPFHANVDKPKFRMEAVRLGELPTYPDTLYPNGVVRTQMMPRSMPFDVPFAVGQEEKSHV